MTATQTADVLQLSVVVAIWVFILFKLVPDTRLDTYRQELFCVRDELFDYAMNGNISFDDPAYVLLRRQMNALIRHAHQLTVFRMFISYLLDCTAQKENSESWHAIWESSLSQISDEKKRNDLKRYHDRAMNIAVKHLIFGSPVLWLVIFVAFLLLIGHGAAMGTRQLLRVATRKVLIGPLDQKRIEDEAFAATA